MKQFFTYFAFALLALSMQHAEAQHQGHACGTSVADQEAIKTRMLENRRNKDDIIAAYNLRRGTNNEDSIFYVPILFHITGQNDGSGYASLDRVLCTLCKINADYRDQNIQFFLYDIRYVNNSLIHDPQTASSGNPTAQYFMQIYKEPSVVNVFIGRQNVGTAQYLAYYTPLVDVMYTFGRGLGCDNPTMTHELGHYFTLPHTFFGWEGTDYIREQTPAGTAPDVISTGAVVEKAVRSGGEENCQTAADGFCDTPPDYVSDRHPCPFTANHLDPTNVAIVPSESNYMSYFNDNCINTFTNQQKEAMLIDFISRGYDRFETPRELEVRGAVSFTSPDQAQPYFYYNSVPLRWNAADGADRYYVLIERMVSGFPVSTEGEYLVMDTEIFLNLAPNRQYRATVRAMNSVDICSNFTETWEFATSDWELNTSAEEVVLESARVFPNPTSSKAPLNLEINSRMDGELSLAIYNSLGQQVAPVQTLQVAAGTSIEQLDVSSLSAGMYIIHLQSAQGRETLRFVLQD